jgi:uncharacterized protein YndB with AHSA1/START domain
MTSAEALPIESALVVHRIIAAAPQDVFEAWTKPTILRQWMGPGEVECVGVEADVRPGGRFRIHMRSDKGDHIGVGEYLEIIPNRKLVFSWSWETGTVKNTQVTVTLRPAGDETEVELLHEKLPERDAVEQHTEGWTQCLDNLEALF